MLIFTVVKDQIYMQRCLELAEKGRGSVSPNPMVGAVLVYDDRIIGEGFHEYYGGPHAEVNCIDAVKQADQSLIASATLYVSLEPCNHHGKTPPCTELIISKNIPRVVLACTDPNLQVCGTGINRLKNAGIEVKTGVLSQAAEDLNKPFFIFHQQQRPYIILKWAQTNDGLISDNNIHPLKISHPITDRLIHSWRAHTDAIMVGTKTLLKDNPQLTVRWCTGKNPLRVVIDKQLKAPLTHAIFDHQAPTLVFNSLRSSNDDNTVWIRLTDSGSWIPAILKALHTMGIQSLLVEGGSNLLQHFLEAEFWDEARVITNTKLNVKAGTIAPLVENAKLISTQQIRTDRIDIFRPQKK